MDRDFWQKKIPSISERIEDITSSSMTMIHHSDNKGVDGHKAFQGSVVTYPVSESLWSEIKVCVKW